MAPMVPPPPGRDSTITFCPVSSVTRLATRRWKVSELAPGVNGMTTVIGLLSRSSARALPDASEAAAIAAAAMTNILDMCCCMALIQPDARFVRHLGPQCDLPSDEIAHLG